MDDQDWRPLLDTRQNQVSILFSESNSIDTKALAVIASAIAILIFAAQASLDIGAWYWGFLLIGGYLMSIALAITSLWNWRYVGAGINLEQHPEYLDFDKQSLLLQLLADTENATYSNQRLNRLRWRLVLASFICFTAGTLALFVII